MRTLEPVPMMRMIGVKNLKVNGCRPATEELKSQDMGRYSYTVYVLL